MAKKKSTYDPLDDLIADDENDTSLSLYVSNHHPFDFLGTVVRTESAYSEHPDREGQPFVVVEVEINAIKEGKYWDKAKQESVDLKAGDTVTFLKDLGRHVKKSQLKANKNEVKMMAAELTGKSVMDYSGEGFRDCFALYGAEDNGMLGKQVQITGEERVTGNGTRYYERFALAT